MATLMNETPNGAAATRDKVDAHDEWVELRF